MALMMMSHAITCALSPSHTLTHKHTHVHMYIYVHILDVEFKFKGHCYPWARHEGVNEEQKH